MAEEREVVLMKGNEAIAHAAIRCGCDGYFGYPITPQSEVIETLAELKPWETTGMQVVQAESELASIYMVYGAAGAGKRAMTSSSSPGIALMQEGITYMAGAEVPGVFVNVQRGGPGLGTIQPSQGDYFQATRGGGNGDYKVIVLAPNSVQEMADFVDLAFELAFKYRNPAMILSDGVIGQMMEPIEWHDVPHRELPPKDWATTGKNGRDHTNVINSLYIDPVPCEQNNIRLQKKFKLMEKNEVRYAEHDLDDAEVVLVAYGTPARICLSALEMLREKGVKAGMFRPISLWPYPYEQLREVASRDQVKAVCVVEMSAGQMLEDVKLSVYDRKPIFFHGNMGGVHPTAEAICEFVENSLKEVK